MAVARRRRALGYEMVDQLQRGERQRRGRRCADTGTAGSA